MISSHMLEGYFTTTEKFVPVHEGFIEGLAKAVMRSLERIIAKPDDYDARAAVMWAGALAWNGLSNAGLEGAAIPCHIIEHPMSGLYNIAHGAGLSAVVPAFLKYKKEKIAGRILQFGRNILMLKDLPEPEAVSSHADACDRVLEAYESWIREIGCSLTMSELGIENPDIDAMVEQAETLARLWGAEGYSHEDYKAVYHLCT